MIRVTVARHFAGLGRAQLVGQGAFGMLVASRGSQTAGPVPGGGAGRVQREYSGCECARDGVVVGSPMSVAKVWLTQSMIGATVRKFAVSSTTPPPSAPKRSAARRNVAMSARRKR